MFKSTIIKGALILTLANIITRILGFVYRIYMSNLIGSEGVGLYQLITPLYLLVWSFTSSGLSTAMNKLTAQEMAKNRSGNCQRLLFLALSISTALSLIIAFAVHSYSYQISTYLIKDSRTQLSLKIISTCFPFMSAGSIIRGYFLGLKNTTVSAISQVLEQSVRMLTVFLLFEKMIPLGLDYACGAAVLGMALGELFSFVYTGIYWLIKSRKIVIKKPNLSYKSAFDMLMIMAVPLTLNRVITSLFSALESVLIPQRLVLFGITRENAISILGILNGMAIPLVMFPSSLLVSLATATMPVISENHELNNKTKIQKTIEQVMFITAIIACGTSGLFITYPKEIGYMFFSQNSLGEVLRLIAFVCPFLYIQVTISGILNGLGEQFFIFKVNMLTSIINLGVIYFLIPEFGIRIFILSWGVCSVLATVMTINRLKNTINLKLHIARSFYIPLFSITVSCILILTAKKYLGLDDTKLITFIVTLITGILYLAIIKLIYVKKA